MAARSPQINLTLYAPPVTLLLDSLLSRLFNLGVENVATKNKKSAPSKVAESETPHVTRVTAIDTAPKLKAAKQSNADDTTTKSAKAPLSFKKFIYPLVALGRYFKGSWYELRQVRWPDRKATWSLTAAVLLFTAFFIVLIVLLDAGFKFLFEQILG